MLVTFLQYSQKICMEKHTVKLHKNVQKEAISEESNNQNKLNTTPQQSQHIKTPIKSKIKNLIKEKSMESNSQHSPMQQSNHISLK